MKNLLLALTIVAFLIFVPPTLAQPKQGQRGGPPPQGRNQANQNNNQAQRNQGQQNQGNQGQQNQRNQNGNQGNQNGNQGMPTVTQLAQMMLANFDADGSGELNQAELESALAAIRDRMQNQANGQNQAGQQRNAIQQNPNQGRQNLQGPQRAGAQKSGTGPPQRRGQGNARRGS